jgi:hypothetical protein
MPCRLSVMNAAMAPICSWVDVATRLSFWPMRPMGCAMKGTVTAAPSVSTGSIHTMATTSAAMVATSRRNTVESRVSASLMNAKSVVKRWVRLAALSRPS